MLFSTQKCITYTIKNEFKKLTQGRERNKLEVAKPTETTWVQIKGGRKRSRPTLEIHVLQWARRAKGAPGWGHCPLRWAVGPDVEWGPLGGFPMACATSWRFTVPLSKASESITGSNADHWVSQKVKEVTGGGGWGTAGPGEGTVG